MYRVPGQSDTLSREWGPRGSMHDLSFQNPPVESMGSICVAFRATEAESASRPAVPDTPLMYFSRTASGSAGTQTVSSPWRSTSCSRLSTAAESASRVLDDRTWQHVAVQCSTGAEGKSRTRQAQLRSSLLERTPCSPKSIGKPSLSAPP